MYENKGRCRKIKENGLPVLLLLRNREVYGVALRICPNNRWWSHFITSSPSPFHSINGSSFNTVTPSPLIFFSLPNGEGGAPYIGMIKRERPKGRPTGASPTQIITWGGWTSTGIVWNDSKRFQQSKGKNRKGDQRTNPWARVDQTIVKWAKGITG